jgi:putative CocE/NonD family hydrolase
LTVGGWFDAEDLWGALETYRAIERQSRGIENTLVMGPWRHGGWARQDGERHGDVTFGQKTSLFYREHIEFPFFQRHLKGRNHPAQPEAWVFETGTNTWQKYAAWPPVEAKSQVLWLHAQGKLSATPVGAAQDESGGDVYVSDPGKPVPYRSKLSGEMDAEYMSDDQRFASRRPDVLVYATADLESDVTFAGPLEASLWVATTGTDADFVVKLVDVYPQDVAPPDPNPSGVTLGGYQQLVRGEVMRGKFRTSFEKPEPFKPNEPALVRFAVPDVCHTFRAGHRIMVQVQSSWFPLVDRNPQTFVDINKATEADSASRRIGSSARRNDPPAYG